MDAALANLSLIFLPGIIWANLDETYGAGPKSSPVKLALNSFLFGVTTYAVLYVIFQCLDVEFSVSNLSDVDKISLADFAEEILWSVPLSVILSVVWLYSVRFRWMMKILGWIGASSRFGPEDVWSFTFNSTQPHVEYVDIRDVENGFIFSGYVNAYSETEDIREILLRDAIVYSDDGTEISSPPHLYLSRPKDKLWVEFPYKKED